MSGRRQFVLAAVGAAVLIVGSSSAALAGKHGAGNIDGKFGSHGKVLTTFAAPASPVPAGPTPNGSGGGSQTHVEALGIQPSGKLIAMGFHQENGTSYYALARYIDGVLDTSFGTGGRVIFPGSGATSPQAMAIQSSGKIVLAGSADTSTTGCQADFYLTRLTVDGALDTSFGTNGQVVTDFGGCDAANAVALGASDSIVAAGFTGGGADVAVARYSADGTPDTGFGSGGAAIGTGFGSALGVAMQTGGRVVIAAQADTSGWSVIGFTSSGALDTTYGNNGSTATSFGVDASTTLAAMALRPNGGVVLAGGNYDGSSYDIALAAYTAGGVQDSNFGSSGTVLTDLSGPGFEDQAGGVTVEGDGTVVIGGWTCSSQCDFAVVQYAPTGLLNSSFGRGGVVTTDFASGSGDLARPVVLQADGKIVAGGYSDALGTGDVFALARYK